MGRNVESPVEKKSDEENAEWIGTYNVGEKILGVITEVVHFEWPVMFVQLIGGFLLFQRSGYGQNPIGDDNLLVHRANQGTVLLEIKVRNENTHNE